MTPLFSCVKALGLGLLLVVSLVALWQVTEAMLRNRGRGGR